MHSSAHNLQADRKTRIQQCLHLNVQRVTSAARGLSVKSKTKMLWSAPETSVEQTSGVLLWSRTVYC